mgnify:CR=1 FL=1
MRLLDRKQGSFLLIGLIGGGAISMAIGGPILAERVAFLAQGSPRGITFNNQYTMLKLFSKFRRGPGDPPPTLFNVCGLK